MILKAVIDRDFQLAERIAIKIIYNFNVLIDLVATVSVNVSAGVRGTSNAVTDASNIAICSLLSVTNILFTAVQTVAIGVQGTIGQFVQGAVMAPQGEIMGAQNVLGKLITNVQVVNQKIAEFIDQCTVFIQGATSHVGDFSVQYNAFVSPFFIAFGGLVSEVTATLSSVTGISCWATKRISFYIKH